MPISKFKAFLFALWILSLFEIFIWKIELIYYIILALETSFLALNFYLFRYHSIFKNGVKYSLLPLILSPAVLVYLTLIFNSTMIHIFAVFNSILIFQYFSNLRPYSSLFLERVKFANILNYGNFWTFFFAFAALYGFYIYLSLPFYLVATIIAPILFILLAQVIMTLWVQPLVLSQDGSSPNLPLPLDFSYKKIFLIISVLGISLLEIGIAIIFLPLNYNILALIFAIVYYVILGLARHMVWGSINNKKIGSYLGFGVLCIILLIFTSRWI